MRDESQINRTSNLILRKTSLLSEAHVRKQKKTMNQQKICDARIEILQPIFNKFTLNFTFTRKQYSC